MYYVKILGMIVDLFIYNGYIHGNINSFISIYHLQK